MEALRKRPLWFNKL